MLFVSSSTRVSVGELKINFPFPHVFCFILYKSERVVLKIEVPPLSSNFPFPHVFSLSPFPLCTPFEGTHDDRVAGGQHSVLA